MEVRLAANKEELRTGLVAIGQYGGWFPTEEEIDWWLKNFELERMHVAAEDGEIIGGAGAFSFDFSIPGGMMPAGGVTVVGVYPTHRRRGVLTEMMRVQLGDVRERGEPIAVLWSSEGPIYGRFGYGMASLQGQMKLERSRSGFAVPYEPVGRIRLIEPDEVATLFPPVWDALRATTPGFFARPPAWWTERIVHDPEQFRGGASKKLFVVHEAGGEVDGYAFYRHKGTWDEGVPTGSLIVREAFGTTPEATRELWRYLLDVDQSQTIESYLMPPDHPLFLLLSEPRRTKYRMGDGLWVRLVDVGAALSGRGYAEDGRVTFDVRDSFCPWNEGRWKLEDGRAAKTDEEPDIRLDVTGLGSVFLGGFTFAELFRACRVEELKPGAIAWADAMFRTDIAPWCPEIF
jgi:predicted acetyltransferase